jgi:S-(hydroxymethyl)glutathione dehydrogenase/alcohol dehydrogenase
MAPVANDSAPSRRSDPASTATASPATRPARAYGSAGSAGRLGLRRGRRLCSTTISRSSGDTLATAETETTRRRPRRRTTSREAFPHGPVGQTRIDPMRIRAAVLEEFGAPLEIEDLELAEPKAGEVLVRLVACGICHTDLYTASGADPSGYAPTVLGHEGAGVVERIGDGVESLRPGDHVVTLFSPQCRECVHCRDERTNLCLAIREQQNKGYLPDGTTRLSRGGEEIRHFMGTSTFAEYTVMPEIALAKITPDAPLDRACVFACGLSTGLGAALNTAKVRPGSTCVVFGAGLVGLGAVAGCRLAGAERIVALDLSAERLELARGQGATDTLVGGPDAVEQVLALTGGFGADYTFEATGNVGVMRQAVESARMGWGLATMCGVAGKGETLDVVPRFLITGRRIAGSSFGGVKGRDGVPRLVDRWLAGEIDVDPLISHRLALDEVNRGFELMEAQDGIRSVIAFDS